MSHRRAPDRVPPNETTGLQVFHKISTKGGAWADHESLSQVDARGIMTAAVVKRRAQPHVGGHYLVQIIINNDTLLNF